MKILMINKTDLLGGAAQVMQNLATGLRGRGHEVRCLVRRKFTQDKYVYELSDNFVETLLRKISGRDVPIVLNNLRDSIMANDIDNGKTDEILNHRLINWADVVHCHNLHGNYFRLDNLIALSKSKPVVWTWHDWWPATGHCATPMSCNRYENGCGKCPNLKTYQTFYWDNTANIWGRKREIYDQIKFRVVVPSGEMESKLSTSNYDITKIFNGVKLPIIKASKTELRLELGLPMDKKIILFVAYGWQNVDKGWKFIEKLKDNFRDNYWLGVGSTHNGYKDGVNYVGVIEHDLIYKYMLASDVFVFPSMAESFGLTAVEAHFAGLPVVAFPVGVIRELVVHKTNGYIAKYGDIKDLESGLNFVLRKQLTIIRKNEFELDRMVSSYEKLYETA